MWGLIMNNKANIHGWFYAYLQTVEGYSNGYQNDIKEAIIMSYSGNKTASLSELYKRYPEAYKYMRRDIMQKLDAKQRTDTDKARKQLIAVVFAYLNDSGRDADMEYVKGVIRKAAGSESFNTIPLSTLKALYRQFGEKQGNIIK